MPTKYIEINGQGILYYYAGATTLPDVIPDFSRGRKILFIHAAGSNAHTWHHQLDHLGGAHSPIAPDLPGHGRSAGVAGLSSIAEYADFAAAFADALGIESAVIAGRSMGGAIAMEFALRYPNRAEALILVATAAKFSLPHEMVEGLRAVATGRAARRFTADAYSPKTAEKNFAVVREGWMEQAKTDPRVSYSDVLACNAVDLRERIATIGKPTLVLAGADDRLTPSADAELIASRIPGARLQVFADAGHNVTTERPAEVNAAIAAFLQELG